MRAPRSRGLRLRPGRGRIAAPIAAGQLMVLAQPEILGASAPWAVWSELHRSTALARPKEKQSAGRSGALVELVASAVPFVSQSLPGSSVLVLAAGPAALPRPARSLALVRSQRVPLVQWRQAWVAEDVQQREPGAMAWAPPRVQLKQVLVAPAVVSAMPRWRARIMPQVLAQARLPARRRQPWFVWDPLPGALTLPPVPPLVLLKRVLVVSGTLPRVPLPEPQLSAGQVQQTSVWRRMAGWRVVQPPVGRLDPFA